MTTSRQLDVSMRCTAILDELERAVVGKRAVLEDILLTVLASGHVLIEDLPGIGKTMVARCFATVLGLTFRRIQFTPDLLPADLTGSSLFDPGTRDFTFRPGPVFTNLILADEINRTPPRTQAALLEAMAEQQVSVDGVTRRLPDPFIVIATANPVEYEGTYPLPEAQLDRFATRVQLGYLDHDDEVDMLTRRVVRGQQEVTLHAITDDAELLRMRSAVEDIEVHPEVLHYVVRLDAATRAHPQIVVGASPRGVLALVQLARARALLAGRTFVLVDDVKSSAIQSLAHRLTLRPELWLREVAGTDIMKEILESVAVPALPETP